MEFQTRSEVSGLATHQTLAQAFQAARKDKSIWKVSFSIPETKERVRLVKYNEVNWKLEPIP